MLELGIAYIFVKVIQFGSRIAWGILRLPLVWYYWRRYKKQLMAESVRIGRDWGGDMAMQYLRENPITIKEWL